MEVVWTQGARNGMTKIYDFIYESSPQNADLILKEITNKTEELKTFPERYRLDDYKNNNKGNYRAFEHKKIRVSYKLSTDTITIVRVKHASQKPKTY